MKHFLKRTEAYASSLNSPTVSETLPTQSGIFFMATIRNNYSSMSKVMAPEITVLNDNEIDEHYRSDSDSSLINGTNVKSDSSEYQNNHWFNFYLHLNHLKYLMESRMTQPLMLISTAIYVSRSLFNCLP